VQTVGEVVGPAALSSRMLPSILSYSRDPVPNLRFNVAKSLERLAPKIDAAVAAAVVKPALQALTTDPDADVRYYAAKALAAY